MNGLGAFNFRAESSTKVEWTRLVDWSIVLLCRERPPRAHLLHVVSCSTFPSMASMVSKCESAWRSNLDMPIIFITGHGDIPISVAAMKAGAVEFLTKPFNDEVLLTATRQAFRAKRGSSCSGGGDTGAQGSLGIAESTVKAHRGQVMQKMKANSVADLVKMIVKLHQSTATNHRMSSG